MRDALIDKDMEIDFEETGVVYRPLSTVEVRKAWRGPCVGYVVTCYAKEKSPSGSVQMSVLTKALSMQESRSAATDV